MQRCWNRSGSWLRFYHCKRLPCQVVVCPCRIPERRASANSAGLCRTTNRYLYVRLHPAAGTDTLLEGLRRHFHNSVRLLEKESSKVERTVKALKEEAEKTKQEAPKVPDAVVPVAAVPKRSLLKRIGDELLHYYHGFRLLFIDIRVSTRLMWKVLNGRDLSRREHKQMVRTVSDLFRLVPFSVFVIVPFMELLLPVAVKLFPNMLPSTFQTSSEKEKKMKKELKVKLEMAKFLQDTLDEMAVQARGEHHSHSAKEFAQFFDKIRTSGEQASNEEILKFSKLFEDEITLDSLSRPQLVALCRLLELQPIGTNNFLRFQLRMRLRALQADDQMIQKEGLDTLTVPELQVACKARGMRALGVPEARLRSQLQQWLELHLNEQIPPSLLLLSRALYLPDSLQPTDQLKATISTLPDAVAAEAKLKIGEKEGKVDNKTKLELIRMEEAAIKKEKEERVQEEKEELKRKQTQLEEAQALPTEPAPEVLAEKLTTASVASETPELLQDTAPVLEDKAVDLASAEKKQEIISKDDIDDLEDALETIAQEKRQLLIEKEELQDLKEEMDDYKEDILEFRDIVTKTGHKGMKESKAAMRLFNRVNRMIRKMDVLVTGLHKEEESLQQRIEDKAKEGKSVTQERDDIVTITELVKAICNIQKVSDQARLQQIADLLDRMDIDHDGAVEVDHVLKVIELLGKENVNVSSDQMNEIIELLGKEERLELQEKLQKQKHQESKADSSQDASRS